MGRKMLVRLLDQEVRLLAGAIGAEQRDEGRLSGPCVLSGPLAGRGFVAEAVAKILAALILSLI